MVACCYRSCPYKPPAFNIDAKHNFGFLSGYYKYYCHGRLARLKSLVTSMIVWSVISIGLGASRLGFEISNLDSGFYIRHAGFWSLISVTEVVAVLRNLLKKP